LTDKQNFLITGCHCSCGTGFG